jgi:hypothetical protein
LKLLRAATAARASDAVFKEQKKIAATVSPDDRGQRDA